MSNNNLPVFNSNQVRILIVDDEPPIRKLVARALEPEGYEICFASDGEEAFSILLESFFDIVITDIVMPKMDGTELIKKIAEYLPADVIAMTGRIDEYSYDHIVGAGACDFVQKPFGPGEILLRVKRVLRERQLKEDLLKSHKELAQSQKFESLGQLSAGIAHEINTPIQYIADNVAFIKDSFQDLNEILSHLKSLSGSTRNDSPGPSLPDQIRSMLNMDDLEYMAEEMPKAIDQTLEGIRNIRNIVKAMKDFAHPGKTEHVYTDLNQCIKNAAIISKNEWKYIADLVLDLDETLPEAFCNPGELNQVFLNLIINAGHAVSDQLKCDSSPKGKIKIKTQKLGNWIEIAVSDTGAGIPEDIKSKIFNPFFTTKEIGKGTGQGLAIARSVVVDRHKGEIEFETAQGKGTTFFIRLPLITRE